MIKVDEKECIGCGVCCTVCPAEALKLDEEENVAKYDAEKCIECYECVEVCVTGAISKVD